MPALIQLVVVDEFGICPLRPAPRGCIDLVGKDAHRSRDRDAFWAKKSSLLSQYKRAEETAVLVNQ